VVEELDPFLETETRALGHDVGRVPLSRCGELDPDVLREVFGLPISQDPIRLSMDLPPRPPVFCPGCPHRGTFYTLRKLGFTVTGDIGCYALSALPPLRAMDSNLCMGASVTMAFGVEKALRDTTQRVAAVIGDSTFAHSGITGLLDVVYNRGHTLTVILDNRTTAMTGFQENPSSGYTAKGEPATALDFAKLGEALGLPPENIAVASPRDLATLEATLRRLDNQPGPILLIALEPCVLHRRASWMGSAWKVDLDLCISCGSCLDLGCPAIIRQDDDAHGSEVVAIDAYLCVGCGLCGQVCPVGAIAEAGLSQSAPSALEGSNA
jgi:indolepyruvate ferredoxin oxidoreductase alpha subunit